MDWTQTLTIMATTVGAMFAFYRLTRDEISVLRDSLKSIESNHRADMQNMDAKWERLFERLLIQDQQRAK